MIPIEIIEIIKDYCFICTNCSNIIGQRKKNLFYDKQPYFLECENCFTRFFRLFSL